MKRYIIHELLGSDELKTKQLDIETEQLYIWSRGCPSAEANRGMGENNALSPGKNQIEFAFNVSLENRDSTFSS